MSFWAFAEKADGRHIASRRYMGGSFFFSLQVFIREEGELKALLGKSICGRGSKLKHG